jgi:hypothetical protein
MALQRCPECGQEVSTEAVACPRCGFPEPGRRASEPDVESTPSQPEGLPDKLRRWAVTGVMWLVVVAFVLAAGANAIDGMWRTAGGLLLFGATVCPLLPLRGAFRATAVVAALFVLGFATARDAGRAADLDAQEARAEEAAVEQQRLDALRAEYQERGGEVLAAMQTALDRGVPLEALQAGAPYQDMADDAFLAVLRTAREQHDENLKRDQERGLVAEVRSVPASDLLRNRDLYHQLRTLVPENARYQERFEHYDGLIKAEERERADRQARFGARPTPSAWDGTYRVVTSYLREIANDPGSIDVDSCTEVYHVEDGWLVGCDYRGANAFGGMIRASNWFIIRHDQVVRMEEASAYRAR